MQQWQQHQPTWIWMMVIGQWGQQVCLCRCNSCARTHSVSPTLTRAHLSASFGIGRIAFLYNSLCSKGAHSPFPTKHAASHRPVVSLTCSAATPQHTTPHHTRTTLPSIDRSITIVPYRCFHGLGRRRRFRPTFGRDRPRLCPRDRRRVE